MKFTQKEILLIEDTKFLLAKANIIEKVNSLLIKTREKLNYYISNSNFPFTHNMNLETGKISRGENYKNLPYLILDYPAVFTTKDTFAFRTMFWWGNFFSFTLHLGGESLHNYRNILKINFDKLLNNNIYICVCETPWEYHYRKDNYVMLESEHYEFLSKCNFLKLSKKIKLKEWNKLPNFSSDFLNLLLSILNNNCVSKTPIGNKNES